MFCIHSTSVVHQVALDRGGSWAVLGLAQVPDDPDGDLRPDFRRQVVTPWFKQYVQVDVGQATWPLTGSRLVESLGRKTVG